MRHFYKVGSYEYWMEPEYQYRKSGRLTIFGCGLYDTHGVYKGYWRYDTWPTALKREVRKELMAECKRHEQAEKRELKAIKMLKR